MTYESNEGGVRITDTDNPNRVLYIEHWSEDELLLTIEVDDYIAGQVTVLRGDLRNGAADLEG